MMFTSLRKTALAMVVGALGLTAVAAPAVSSTFYGWQVTNVPLHDTLNVRTGPSSGYAILVSYPNGTPLSLTGQCTGGVQLGHIAHWPKWKQRQAVRYKWCQLWLDPFGNGQYQPGWVYGRYIRPL